MNLAGLGILGVALWVILQILIPESLARSRENWGIGWGMDALMLLGCLALVLWNQILFAYGEKPASTMKQAEPSQSPKSAESQTPQKGGEAEAGAGE